MARGRKRGKFIASAARRIPSDSEGRCGVFIVFEGTDGSGKATQLKLLASSLKKKGYQVEQTDFPCYYTSFFGKLTGRFLKGEFGGINDVSPYLACLPYAGDRFEAKAKIKKWLSQGKIVISNRYTGSQAHQAAKLPVGQQARFLRFVQEMEYGVFGIPKEDIVIFLYVPPKIGQRLVDKKGNRGYVGGKKRDIHEADLEHLKKASRMYLRLARRYPHWVKVNCCGKDGKLIGPNRIHRKILKVLVKRQLLTA